MRIVGGIYKNRSIVAPKGALTRPTASRLRETLFNICQTYIEDAIFLDLFAGSGAMGLEALSRGAAQATFVDMQRSAIAAIRINLADLKALDKGEVVEGDVVAILKRFGRLDRTFDIIYVDPPYGKTVPEGGFYSRLVVELISELDLLTPRGMLFIEESEEAKEALSSPPPNLRLVGSRKAGPAFLWQYQRKDGLDE